MDRLRTHLLLLTITLGSSLPAQELDWVSHYGNNGNNASNFGFKLVEDNAGAIYGVGTTGGSGLDLDGHFVSVLGELDILLVKWDTLGRAVWARTAGGICPLFDWDEGRKIAYDEPGQHIIIAGRYNCSETHFGSHVITADDGDQANMFVASYDTAGTCLWANGARGSIVGATGILVDHLSNVFVIGGATSGAEFLGPTSATIPPGGFVVKYGPDGDFLHAERILTGGGFSDVAWASGSEWVLSGAVSPGATLYGEPISVPSSDAAGFVALADTSGTIGWLTSFGSDSVAQVWQCTVGLDGTIYAAGYFIDNLILPEDTIEADLGTRTFFLAALDGGTGNVVWLVPIRSLSDLSLYELEVGPNGDLYIYGRFVNSLIFTTASITSDHSQDAFVARFNPAGECEAAWGLGPVLLARGAVLPTENGLYVASDYDSTLVLGPTTIQPSHEGLSDLFLARFDQLDGFTGVQSRSVPNEELHIYANPNNGLCTVDLPHSLRLTNDLLLSVFDQTGRLVQRVPLGYSSDGLRLDIRAQAKGVYHVELTDGAQRYTGTIVFE